MVTELHVLDQFSGKKYIFRVVFHSKIFGIFCILKGFSSCVGEHVSTNRVLVTIFNIGRLNLIAKIELYSLLDSLIKMV